MQDIKRVGWFLLGVTISIILIAPYVRADEFEPSCTFVSRTKNSSGLWISVYSCGKWCSLSAAKTWINTQSEGTWTGDGSLGTSVTSCTGKLMKKGYRQYRTVFPEYNRYDYWYYDDESGDPCYYCTQNPADIDSDGDGIPDINDIYPDDPTPYKIRKVMSVYDGDGNEIGAIWKTDRNDGEYFYTGIVDVPDGGSTRYWTTSPWLDPATDGPSGLTTYNPGGSGGVSDPTDPTDPINPIVDNNPPDPSGDDGFSGGDPWSDGDTDSMALAGIQNNTATVADNTQRLGDYLAEINDNIEAMNARQALADGNSNDAGSGTVSFDDSGIVGAVDGIGTKMDGYRTEDQATADNTLSDQANYDPTSDNSFDPSLTEGVDYINPGEIKDKSWFTDFIDDNPLTGAFANSGFSLSGAVCSIDLDLGYLGVHTLSLCNFEDEFRLFGVLLLSLTSLAALIIIVRG